MNPTPPGGQAPGPLAAALTAEHVAIDAGIDAFVARAGTAGPLQEWATPLREAMTALRRHIYLEEEVVFPRVRSGALTMPVMVMLREHGEIWRAMDALEAGLDSNDADEEPLRSELLAGCQRMLELLALHNEKEEPIIYPHLDTDMDWVAQAHLRELIEEGTLPHGWVCERAAG